MINKFRSGFAELSRTFLAALVRLASIVPLGFFAGAAQADFSGTLHFHGNVDDGCTGAGQVDEAACSGPFLLPLPTLAANVPAARWVVAANVLPDTSAQSLVLPNWTWNLTAPTTVSGYTTIQWWASTNAECVLLGCEWDISVWADGVNKFTQTVSGRPALPEVPSLLNAGLTLPTITATATLTLRIDPHFSDSGSFNAIFYDSQLPCAVSATGTCDSTITFGAVAPPAITFNSSSATVVAGSAVTLTWSATSATSCAATGDWTGTKATSGSESVTVSTVGSHTYTLTCTGSGGSSSSSVTVLGTAASGGPPAARFETFLAPQGLADNWGEPSVGVDWLTEKSFSNSAGAIPNGGTVVSFGGFGSFALRIAFNDGPSPALPAWSPSAGLTTVNAPRLFGDPILYTDHTTGRTLVDQLVGLTPFNTVELTDDDGNSYMVSEGNGVLLPSVDHETFGGGPYASPLPPSLPSPVYPNAIYYCAQTIAYATCSLSVDGGLTFLPAVPIYSVATCKGLHGHVKVSPKDGSVYVPNASCGGGQAVVASEDDGVTWTVNPLPANALAEDRDPSVSIDNGGTLYFAYRNGNPDGSRPLHVVVSPDHGKTWAHDVDVGKLVSPALLNTAFPAAVAGDGGRAAVAFFGSTTGGNYAATNSNGASTFPGVWYLYIATTYNGGQTWDVVNATPNAPIQRGSICGANGCRNLLDFFDASVDKEGRVIVGYEDGCVGTCQTDTKFLPKAGMARGAIARQSGGRRMFAANDPVEPAAPKAPLVSATVDATGGVAHLSWSTPDNSGFSAPATYNVYRAANASGGFALVASGVTSNAYDDAAFTTGNVYHVTAVNGQGEGPYYKNVAPSVAISGQSPCVAPGITALTNASGKNTGGIPGEDLTQVLIAEPKGDDSKLIFTMKVDSFAGGQPPPETRWLVYFATPTAIPNSGQTWYVSMITDQGQPRFVYGTKSTVNLPNLPVVGTVGVGTFHEMGNLDGASNFAPDGTITLVLDKSALTTDRAVKPGDPLTALVSQVRTTVPSAPNTDGGEGLTVDTAGDGTTSYTLRSLDACTTAPTAVLGATPLSGTAPLTVSFDASASHEPDTGDSVGSYTFHFGDGSADVTQPLPTIQHVYATAGSYAASLVVKESTYGKPSVNAAGVNIQVATRVNSGVPFGVTLTSDVNSGDVSNGPVLVHFTATVSGQDGSPLTYTIAFGDNPNSTATMTETSPGSGVANVTYQYRTAGTFHPYVTVTEDYASKATSSGINSDIITTTSSVNVTAVVAKLVYSLTHGAVAPAGVVFDTSGSQGQSWTLDFGDASTPQSGTGNPTSQITHSYLYEGTFTATLTVTDGQGHSSVATQNLAVTAQQVLTAELQFLSASSGLSPLKVVFDACQSQPANDGTQIVSYTMDFGDGTTLMQMVDSTHMVNCAAKGDLTQRAGDPSVFTHVYSVGTSTVFTPKLTVTDNASTPRASVAKSLQVSVQGVNAPLPAAVNNGGGGGGSLGFLTLLPLMGVGLLRRRRIS